MPIDVVLDTLDALPDSSRPVFLSELGFYIGQAARGRYPDVGLTATTEAVNQLRAFNEMVIIVTDELMKVLRGQTRRTNADFIECLRAWASSSNCGADLNWALTRALHIPV